MSFAPRHWEVKGNAPRSKTVCAKLHCSTPLRGVSSSTFSVSTRWYPLEALFFFLFPVRHEGDTVNFSGLEITKTRKGFEVKNSTDLVEFLLKLHGLQNSKPTVNPGRRSTVMELASPTPLDGHDYSHSRTAVGKLIFMAHAICHPTTIHIQVLNPTTESKRAVQQLIRYLNGSQHTCLRRESREMVQKGLLELVGRSGSDWAGDSATRQSVTGYHCDVQNVTMCNRSLKQTAISLCSCRSRVLRSQCLRRRTVGTRRTLQGTALQCFSSCRRWIQTRQDTFCSAGDQADSNTLKYDAWRYNSGHENNVCRWCEWTRTTILQISSRKHPDGLRTQSPAKKQGLRIPGWYEWYKWGRLRNGHD